MGKKRKKTGLAVLFLLFLVLMCAVPANAAAKYADEWVTASSGKTYYYGEDGKKVTGMKKIGKRYYYFDSKGVQKTGWYKIKGSYYFFRINTKAKGYRIESKTVNGVALASDGKAKLTSYSKRKLPLLVKANTTMQSITNDKMTKTQKLKKVFDYSKSHLKARNRGGFQKGDTWDIFYAEIAFNSGFADCYSFAAYFAYLANAVGYKATVVSSGGHGWAEIGGKVYDPNWSNVDKRNNYFGMSYDLSGVGGRPSYKRNRVYLKTV